MDEDTFDTPHNIYQEMQVSELSILLQRSQSRVKQLEFDLAVSKETAELLMGGNICDTKKQEAPALNKLLSLTQQKLAKFESESKYQTEQMKLLQSELTQLRKRSIELELERSIHLSKIDECMHMLEVQSSPEEHNLQRKVLNQTALSHQVKSLERKLKERDATIEDLKDDKKKQASLIKELKKLLEPQLDSKQIRGILSTLNRGDELAPEQAQLLTTMHLKSQVEALQEEKSTMMDRIQDLSRQVDESNMASLSSSSTRSSFTSLRDSFRKKT